MPDQDLRATESDERQSDVARASRPAWRGDPFAALRAGSARARLSSLSLKADGTVAGFIAAVTVAALCFFYSRGLTNIYGDAIAHMEGARRVFDSLTPLQIGNRLAATVSLPGRSTSGE